MATMKEKTVSNEIILTNIFALLCNGHEFWAAEYDRCMAQIRFFPKTHFLQQLDFISLLFPFDLYMFIYSFLNRT